ncbi:MAG: sigma-E processing peptidase SpoIIGA [Clostridia bacterium]|nr:sigma-E processing peptidase SpoIIGA [Clostridia bacterium]
MTEYIYGDVLFIINFSMDFLALFICGKIMHFRMNVWRMIGGASIGGVYGVAALFFSIGTAGDIALDVFAAFLICLTAHHGGRLRKTAAATAMFYAVSLLMGGAMTAIYSRIGRYTSYIEIGGSISTVFGEMDIWVFVLLAAASAFATFFLQKALRARMSGKFCRVRIRLDGEEYEFSGFLDSGNCASEPISGRAVIFIAASAALEAGAQSLVFCRAGNVTEAEAEKVRFVPINTVSGYSLAAAIKPEKLEIMIKHDFEERDALIVCDEHAHDYSGAQALVPLSLL